MGKSSRTGAIRLPAGAATPAVILPSRANAAGRRGGPGRPDGFGEGPWCIASPFEM
jgi:hypothetical protein